MAIAHPRLRRRGRPDLPAGSPPTPAAPQALPVRRSLTTLVGVWTRLVVGLWLFAAGIALMVRGHLGVSSWDVLHDALRVQSPLTFGAAMIAVAFLVLVGSFALGVKPGPGTIANVVLVGAFTDVLLKTPLLEALPETNVLIRLTALLVGVVAIALGTAIYISAGLGAGPRDSLMIAASRRLHLSTGTSRALIEGSVLAAGALMGGRVGPGTAVFAMAIGPAINISFRLFGMEPPRRRNDSHLLKHAAQPPRRWARRGQLGATCSTEKSRYTGGRI